MAEKERQDLWDTQYTAYSGSGISSKQRMVLNRGLNEGAVKCERVYDTQLLFSHSSKSTQWDGLAMLARPASKNTASFLAKENLVRVVKISKKSNFQH